ncbi:MAG: alpha/beta hydrolase fold domain-containing protein, partial [Ilumatobacter sp.]|nr:alpha/beta hydrolase fold domain-containing protein [Ilumatobacter sp.]
PSMEENAEGFVLTADLMSWFWNHYADTGDRADPLASPLHADSRADLPPAVIVTAEFDPLRDEGEAYADALEAAGVEVHRHRARGHLHTTIHAVGVIISGAPERQAIAEQIRALFARRTAHA